jgi:hypothetical protein
VTAAFSQEERDLLLRLPRLIVAAASAAEEDSATRTAQEVEAGFIAVANGRDTGNAFVADIARRAMDNFDNKAVAGMVRGAAGIEAILDQLRTGWQYLKAKAAPADAAAYARWIIAITDDVITAVRSGDVLGMGGVLVSDSEKAFRDKVVAILRS